MGRKGTKAETELRVMEFITILAGGGKRSDCVRHASDNWGVGSRTVDQYLSLARDQIRADWDLQRPQMIADLLAQYSTLQMEARQRGQLSVALGCINNAARLAKLVS